MSIRVKSWFFHCAAVCAVAYLLGGSPSSAANRPHVFEVPFERVHESSVESHVVSWRGGLFDQLREQFLASRSIVMRQFPLTAERSVDIRLRPVVLMPPGGRAVIVGSDGVRYYEPEVVTWSGSVEGQPGSYAFLSVTQQEIHSYVNLPTMGSTFTLSSGNGRPIQREAPVSTGDSAEPGHDSWRCDVEDIVGRASSTVSGGVQAGSMNPLVRIALVFVEGDHRYVALFGKGKDAEVLATNYVITIFSLVSDIYRRDLGVIVRVPANYIRMWTELPPWDIGNGPNLFAIKNYWTSEENPYREYPRAAVHVLTHPDGMPSGRGNVGGICDDDSGYSYGTMLGTFSFPEQHTSLQNFDPISAAHEVGHVFGSKHSQGAPLHIPCDDGSGPDLGTIMSYCGIEGPEYVDVDEMGLRFHARVQQVIIDKVSTVDCDGIETIELALGDYDTNGVIDDADLDQAYQCAGQQFFSAGCVEMFDIDDDGAVTFCDYDGWRAIVHPGLPIRDCDGNGIEDGCDIRDDAWFSEMSAQLSPVVEGVTLEFLVASPAWAVAPVTIAATASADLANASQYITLNINGNEAGRLFESSGPACGALARDEDLVIPASLFNGWVDGGDALITLVPENAGLCAGSSIHLEVDYVGEPALDCNYNGTLDECDIASGSSEDVNGNGTPDECECLGDVNDDRVVDGVDRDIVLEDWGESESPADINEDGTVDLQDLVIVIENWGACPYRCCG